MQWASRSFIEDQDELTHERNRSHHYKDYMNSAPECIEKHKTTHAEVFVGSHGMDPLSTSLASCSHAC